MWKENLYRPFEILLREHDDFPIGRHQHSFYEMVYILSGSGDFEASVFGSGQEHCRYRECDLFLIPPDTPHLFTIECHSRYVFIRFTQNYLSDFVGAGLAGLLELKSDFRIGLSGDDSGTVDRLMEMIVRETGSGRDFSEHLLQHYVHSVVLVCARNLSAIEPVRERAAEGRPRYMLQYIQQHLHQPELLTLEAIAAKFHISPKYAGRFFKRNFGEDYKQYLTKSRLRTVEDLLLNSGMTVKEIAAQTGYVDSCYLSRLFKRHYGVTPLQYRKRRQAEDGRGYSLDSLFLPIR